MPGLDDPTDLEGSFAQVAIDLFASGTVDGTLRQIVSLAKETVDGCDAAGVLLIRPDESVVTLAASDPIVTELDQAQIDVGEGPCLDASRSGATFYAEDLVDDPRWPRFAEVALAADVRSVLAFSLSAQRMSALNLYASLPAAFGAIDRAKGQLFATLARLALDAAEAHAADELRSDRLTDALRSRELIGQAQGILMERERITAEQAFDVLRRASQHMNVKLREVAATLVETGESPADGHPPA